MSTKPAPSVRESTVVNFITGRSLSLAAAESARIDMDAIVAQAIWALPDGVRRLRSYLLATGNDPKWVGKITHLTHGGGGELDLALTDFQYSVGNINYTPTILAQSVFENPTGAEITQTFTYSKATTETFAFKFNEGLKIGASTKLKAGLPFIGSGETSISAEITFGAEQAWTDTTQRTWSASLTIRVPAQSKLQSTASLSMASFSASFTCKARVLGCPAYLVGTGNDSDDSCVDVVVPLTAFFPTVDEMPFAPMSGNLTGSEGVNVMVVTQAIP